MKTYEVTYETSVIVDADDEDEAATIVARMLENDFKEEIYISGIKEVERN